MAWRTSTVGVKATLQLAGLTEAEAIAGFRAWNVSLRRDDLGEIVAKDPAGARLYAASLEAINGAVRALRGHASGEVVCAPPPCADLRGSFDVRAAFAAAVR